jgi:hypothetical protein
LSQKNALSVPYQYHFYWFCLCPSHLATNRFSDRVFVFLFKFRVMDQDIKLAEKYFAVQKVEWRIFRACWILMGLVLAGAALGLFGKGLLSNRTYAAQGVQITYPRFMRIENETELYIRVNEAGSETVIGINNDYLRKVRIDQVIPEPRSVQVRDNTLIYRFHPVQNGFLTFFLRPQRMGSHPLEITVAGKKLRFHQYIYF